MHKRYTKLAAQFLEEYSDVRGNAGCNDWDYPDDWDETQRKRFTRQCIAFNECRELETVTDQEVEDEMPLADFCAISLIAHMLAN